MAEVKSNVELDEIDFEFGEGVEGTLKKNGDLLVKYNNSAFYDNAAKANLSKKMIRDVFKFTEKYNEEFVKHAANESVKLFKKNEKIKRVVNKAGYGMGGSVIATVQKDKVKRVGDLESKKTINEPYVSLKVKDRSLPSKNFMKEITASLVKKLK